MSTTSLSGPSYTVGDMTYLPASLAGETEPDYNPDAAPSLTFQGEGVPDVRFVLNSAKLIGYTGVQPGFLTSMGIETVDAVPAAFGTAKIAAAAHATSGTAMTLASTNAAGITTNVPISAFNGAINGNAITIAPIVLDFGFAFGTVTSGSKTITVADSTQFTLGMPLIIPGALTSSSALITWVTGTPTATTITINDAPGASGTLAIGCGDMWLGAGSTTQAYSLGHLPYIAGGPGLFFDPAQALTRGVSITTGTGGSGGNITVSGWDVYWQPMNEVIAASATGSTTVYGKKAFKAIKSVTPAFTDATGTYSVGTSDVFGFNLRARNWERCSGAWAAGFLTGSGGFTSYTAPGSGDVRGTIQVSAQGGGTGYGSTNSNGAVSGLVMTGNRLALFQSLSVADTIAATARSGGATMYGATQT